ncbi:MAG: hypothetical protein ACF787_03070 [Rhodopirellula sp. JB053]
MADLIKNDEYRDWIVSIKSRVQASQIKAAVAINYAMLELYWFHRAIVTAEKFDRL